MMTSQTLQPEILDRERPMPLGQQPDALCEGVWYWVANEEEDWLGCITHLGSNYAELTGVDTRYTRVHFDEFDEECRPAIDATAIIKAKQCMCKRRSSQIMLEIRTLTAALGCTPRQAIGDVRQQASGTGIATISGRQSPNKYKNALVRAKDVQLPALFDKLRDSQEELTRWMSADLIPLGIEVNRMQGMVGVVEDRIHSVSLYSGLAEDVQQIRGGAPAAIDAKLHLMQRMHYMDEECVAQYRTGGMTFGNIRVFDRWLLKKANFDRIFPHPRTAVAFKVRRHNKDREWDGTMLGAFINFDLALADELTFLYIRNGDHLYRVNTDYEFGGKLFPDILELDFTRGMWGKYSFGQVEQIITDVEYMAMCDEDHEIRLKDEVWERAHPEEGNFHNPYRHHYSDMGDWHPFNNTSVYYDDIAACVAKQAKDYNQLALILQGLFDRSPILHPHPPVRLWENDGMAAAVVLVRDDDMVLPATAQPPDFHAYMAQCNAEFKKGSVAVGQEDYWERAEAAKENERDWKSGHRLEHWRPYGNPGPGVVAKVARWRPKAKKAVFKWRRDRLRATYTHEDTPILTSITVPAKALFNISAYKPGDWQQFFRDGRTRAQYMGWAYVLLTAEEYHAGNIKVRKD